MNNSLTVDSDTLPTKTPTKMQRWFSTLGWTFLTIFFLVFFTILKLPEERVKNYIEESIASTLRAQNIGFSADEGHISILFGASYLMKGITLRLPPPSPVIHLEEITVSPSLLRLLLGQFGGKIKIKPEAKDSGLLTASIETKQEMINLSYELKSIDLGKTGLLALLAHIQGTGAISGKGHFNGNMSNPSSAQGQIELNITQLQIESQSIQGFTLPPVRISEGKIDLNIDQGKVVINTFNLGKSNSDDIRLKLTGSAQLAPELSESNLNAQAEFSLSPAILKAFSLLDMILGPGKQTDGSYAFQLTGPILTPTPTPVSR